MSLDSSTKISSLIEQYPFMLDYLAAYHPHFNKLRNPILRQTLGRVATLATAAEMAGVSVEKLLSDITLEIQSRTTGDAKVESSPAAGDDRIKIEALKSIIRDLHSGGDFNQLKARFSDLVKDVSAQEIAAMEQQLISEGMPQTEIKKLCDVHVAMFKDSLDFFARPGAQPGHPVHTFIMENQALLKVITEMRSLALEFPETDEAALTDEQWGRLSLYRDQLSEVEKHYRRKEYQLFPALEHKGFSGPSQVMWAIHDDIRAGLKKLRTALENRNFGALTGEMTTVLTQIEDMIYKEEHILLPVALDLLTEVEWAGIKQGGEEFGYSLITPGDMWKPKLQEEEVETMSKGRDLLAHLPLDTGLLSLEQLNLMLMHLPVELSFVDETDTVRYYTQKPDKIFPRSPGVIGRKVQNCHPPKSLDKVNAILSAFRAGTRDHADFWIQMQNRFLHIRYFAVRDFKGEYRGCLEVVQDVTDIRQLEGERRLLEWEA